MREIILTRVANRGDVLQFTTSFKQITIVSKRMDVDDALLRGLIERLTRRPGSA